MPGFFEAFKNCLSNKSFRWAIPAFMGAVFVESLLPTLAPLIGKYVLGIGEGDSFFISLLLGVTFISTAICIALLWKPITQKIGVRKMWIYSSIVWILTLAPLLFINNMISGFIVFGLMGLGLSGSLYSKALIISNIIDEDEVKTGNRRDASYFGIYIFFLRLSSIFVFLSINLVFTNIGWTVFEPDVITPQIIIGLRMLGFVFPAIALTVVILAMYKYPLHGEKLKKVIEDADQIHEEKRTRILK
jgi:GPH family glycoside/pentoside/hexuronide:cation symporter